MLSVHMGCVAASEMFRWRHWGEQHYWAHDGHSWCSQQQPFPENRRKAHRRFGEGTSVRWGVAVNFFSLECQFSTQYPIQPSPLLSGQVILAGLSLSLPLSKISVADTYHCLRHIVAWQRMRRVFVTE